MIALTWIVIGAAVVALFGSIAYVRTSTRNALRRANDRYRSRHDNA